MQLKNKKKTLTSKLRLATMGLMATTSITSASAKSWKLDFGTLAYKEIDRVTAIEPKISYSHFFSGDKTFNFKFTFDSLTGASHNGASPSKDPVTFTRPSGNGSYAIAGEDIPLDDTFRDSRYAISTSWTQPIVRNHNITVGLNGSKEYDFFSLAGSAMYSMDLNQKNTTLAIGASYENDEIKPKGKIPIPFEEMAPKKTAQPRGDSTDSKDVYDALLGVTQVINKDAIAQLNYSFSHSSGYLTDPFKIVSVVSDSGANQGEPLRYLYENRPDSRTKHSLFALLKYHFDAGVMSDSYRFFIDDWGIVSHTFDIDFRYDFADKMFLTPSMRFYMQSEADFYRHSIKNSETLPKHLSADQRLAEFMAITPGIQFGYKLKNDQSWSVRLQYYRQMGESSPSDAIGVQKDLDLFPTLEAYIAQVLYTI